ncbi:MAG: type II secretion system protein J [Leptolyngbyaceae cyanobacterium]
MLTQSLAMTLSSFLYKLSCHRQRQFSQTKPCGFTLLELLVAMFLASGIVTALLLMTNQLLASDQRESVRTEAQRNMQTALDYIKAELQQAVYVYDQNCLDGTDNVCPGFFGTNADINALLPPLEGYETATRQPILTFWKQQPLPDDIKDLCADLAPDVNGQASLELLDTNNISCSTGYGYTLVVYAYSENGDGGGAAPWDGTGGILRYEMALSTDADILDNYVSPIDGTGVKFREWPSGGTPTLAAPEMLVDFVDDFAESNFTSNCEERLGTTYLNTSAVNPEGEIPKAGFFACVNTAATTETRFGNQDVVIYLRGHARGTASLPTLQTQVFLRSVVGRTPN